jgi:glycosyltransferase involved in cell wall biosynthesis
LVGWPSDKIRTKYNHIDVDQTVSELFKREEARDALGLPRSAFVIGNVGRLHPDKDQATLIKGFAQALPQLPQPSILVILGEGKLRQSLEALAEELGASNHVRFQGQVACARRYFSAFDLFILTSDREPFGMVLLEAMAARVPIIATDCGGAPEILGDTGQLFPFQDDQRLAKLIAAAGHLSSSKTVPQADQAFDRLKRYFSDAAAINKLDLIL